MKIDNIPKNLWKVTIDPRGKTNPDANSFRFCQDKSIVGIGWGFSKLPKDKAEANQLFVKEHGKGIKAFNVIVHRMDINDHAWVYGDSKYYVCCINSDWEHRIGNEWDEHDIHNYRKATWKEVPMLLVPGCIKRSLTMFGTAQAISSNQSLLKYSDWLFRNQLDIKDICSNLNINDINIKLQLKTPHFIFNVIDADETEDLVGLFLQHEMKWLMMKSSAYKSKRVFECEFQRSQHGLPETAYMQVKSGHSINLDCQDYIKYLLPNSYIYLFSTSANPYLNTDASDQIIPIKHEDVFSFALNNIEILPLSTIIKLSIIL